MVANFINVLQILAIRIYISVKFVIIFTILTQMYTFDFLILIYVHISYLQVLKESI